MGIARVVSCCAVACALAMGIVGCGDGGTTGTGDSAAQTTGAAGGRGAQWTGPVPAAFADIGQRLEDAGYEPGSAKDSKPTKANPGFIRVLMHEGAATFVGPLSKGTTKKTLAQTVKGSEGKLAAEIVGSNIYVASSGENLLDARAKLTDEQIAEFHEIVATVSDQG